MEKFEVKTLVIVLTCLFLVLGLFVFMFFIVYRRNQNTRESEIEKLNKTLLQTQLEIQEQTLKTISQEIHDNIGQVLSLVKLNLNTLDLNGGEGKAEKLDNSMHLVSKAINDLRDLSRSMSGDKIADLGLPDAMENELRIIGNTGQHKTNFTLSGDVQKLQQQQNLVVFRIVQESLHNAVKYSKAANISGQMVFAPERLLVSISDDGKGFDSKQLDVKKTGIGLKNMLDRAQMIGASLYIKSEPGKGTRIDLDLPLNK